MESALSKMTVPRKRKSMISQLESWEAGEDQELLKDTLSAAVLNLEGSFGFRWQAIGTQNKQDATLREYRRVIAVVLQSKSTSGIVMDSKQQESANDGLVFPEDKSKLIEYACLYLSIAAKTICPRSRDKDKPRISTIVGRRADLYFWLTYGRMVENAPARHDFYVRTDETIRYLAANAAFDHSEVVKTYLGRDELLQLVDYDQSITPSIEVAEQHAVMWMLGCYCGIRTGAIGAHYTRPGKFLQWKDIEITRDLAANTTLTNVNFTLKITFRHLKKVDGTANPAKPQVMRVTSPRTDRNLSLSLPHRMLVMLLRRGYLEDHKSIQSLLFGNEHQIQIQKSAMKRPVFLAGEARGLSLNQQTPISVGGITSYLKTRTKWLGYPLDVTFYCWRRRAGTMIQRAQGTERAKQFLNHTSRSSTYEKYYEEGLKDLDVVSIMLDGGDGKDTDGALRNEDAVAIHHTKLVRRCAQRDLVVNKYVEGHPDIIAAIKTGSNRQVLNAERRVRQLALTAIVTEEKELQKAQMTQNELRRRISELNQMPNLVMMINERLAHEEDLDFSLLLTTNSKEDFQDAQLSIENYESREDSEEGIQDEDKEKRGGDNDTDGDEGMWRRDGDAVKDTMAANDASPSEVFTVSMTEDDEEGAATDSQHQLWPNMVFMMMRLLLDHEVDKTTTFCCVCQADPWVPEEKKSHDYKRVAKLKEHLRTNYHDPFQSFARQMAYLAKEEGSFVCPYGCKSRYSQFSHLAVHIRESSLQVEKYGWAHEARKKEGGWYEPGWDPMMTVGQRSDERRKSGAKIANTAAPKSEKQLSTLSSFPDFDHYHVSEQPRRISHKDYPGALYYGGD